MHTLAEIQNWMRWSITDPRGVEALLADPASGTRLEPAPRCFDAIDISKSVSGTARLGVYAEGYYLRILEALEADFPTLRQSLGEKSFRKLTVDFLVAHPSDSFNLGDLGEKMPAFIQTHELQETCNYLGAIATLEWATTEAFYSSFSEPFDPSALASVLPEAWTDARMKLDHSIRFHQFDFPVDVLWQARASTNFESIEKSLVPERVYLLVHRPGGQSQVERVERAPYQILRRFAAGDSLGEVLDSLPEKASPSDVMGWFGAWIQSGVIRNVEFPS